MNVTLIKAVVFGYVLKRFSGRVFSTVYVGTSENFV